MRMRTQVGIVGAGPAGMLLSHLLYLEGIDSVVLEKYSREHIENRVRAGVLEQGTVDLLKESGVGERMKEEGMVHHGIELRFDGQRHRIPLSDLTGGRAIVFYGQQEVVKDLIRARLEAGGQIIFEAEAVSIDDHETQEPTILYQKDGEDHEMACDFVVGCDGSHSVARSSLPEGVLRVHERECHIGWLGILADVAPSTEEAVYANQDRGFALLSMRSPEVSRFYLQCDPDDTVEDWVDERIWEELHTRLATTSGDWTLEEGPVLEKVITPVHGFVVEPMQHGRLFLAGDAAHVEPPTGAKGANLAVDDARVLAQAFSAWYDNGRADLLESYSVTRLRRAWHVQAFSWWMTSMLHRFDDTFHARVQHAQLEHLCTAEAAARSFAENYVGAATEPDTAAGR